MKRVSCHPPQRCGWCGSANIRRTSDLNIAGHYEAAFRCYTCNVRVCVTNPSDTKPR
jgi:hypothetical protein